MLFYSKSYFHLCVLMMPTTSCGERIHTSMSGKDMVRFEIFVLLLGVLKPVLWTLYGMFLIGLHLRLILPRKSTTPLCVVLGLSSVLALNLRLPQISLRICIAPEQQPSTSYPNWSGREGKRICRNFWDSLLKFLGGNFFFMIHVQYWAASTAFYFSFFVFSRSGKWQSKTDAEQWTYFCMSWVCLWRLAICI